MKPPPLPKHSQLGAILCLDPPLARQEAKPEADPGCGVGEREGAVGVGRTPLWPRMNGLDDKSTSPGRAGGEGVKNLEASSRVLIQCRGTGGRGSVPYLLHANAPLP